MSQYVIVISHTARVRAGNEAATTSIARILSGGKTFCCVFYFACCLFSCLFLSRYPVRRIHALQRLPLEFAKGGKVGFSEDPRGGAYRPNAFVQRASRPAMFRVVWKPTDPEPTAVSVLVQQYSSLYRTLTTTIHMVTPPLSPVRLAALRAPRPDSML